MARKRFVFFSTIQSFLTEMLNLIKKNIGKSKRFLISFLLPFCLTVVMFPLVAVVASVPPPPGDGEFNSKNSLLPVTIPPNSTQQQPAEKYALPNIETLVNLSANIPNSPSNQSSFTVSDANAESLTQKAKSLYESGQFSQSANIWQQLAKNYAAQGDKLNQAMALSNLSLCWQQLGELSQANQTINESLKLLEEKRESTQYWRVLAQALNTRGTLLLAMGQSEDALDTWEKTQSIYSKVGDENGILRSQLNQSLALQDLGLYRRDLKMLNELKTTLEKKPDSPIKAVFFRNLGNALRVAGNLNDARQAWEQSLQISRNLQLKEATAQSLVGLGNTVHFQQDNTNALKFYQEAYSISDSPSTRSSALLNQLSLLTDIKKWSEAQALWSQIPRELVQLPISRNSVYAKINLADSLITIFANNPGDSNSNILKNAAAQWLGKAVQEAKDLGDKRAESYALGQMGELYEKNQQWKDTEKLTQQALVLAQALNASDVAYKWQWQLGRIFKATNRIDDAISAYSEAVNTLKSLRSDLVSINSDVQFSFRETVEPVYRELVSLLLQDKQISQNKQNIKSVGISKEDKLIKAREVIESLQLAELDNFFREACLNAKHQQIDKIDAKAAVIYPIILSDRLEVVVSLPGQPLRNYSTPLLRQEIETNLNKLRQELVTRSGRKFLPLSQQVYDWLIRPIEADLSKAEVSNLVFVPDGVFRNIPMAALHDGKQFLIEKYGIALTSGLQLLDPKPLARVQLKALMAGLTEPKQGFAALPNVAQEVQKIKSEVPAQVFLNENFTSAALQKEIQSSPFPVIHLATHGQFSSNAEDTFILTWDNKINVNELNNMLRSYDRSSSARAIELLVLSACQTAAGDNRAALGLAGVAVRAGARSTIASLWYIDDGATVPLMAEFYRQLSNTKLTKAESLRRAQISLLKTPQYRHPIYWAPYVLVGNWL